MILVAMHGILCNSYTEFGIEDLYENIAEAAVNMADALLLKAEEEQ